MMRSLDALASILVAEFQMEEVSEETKDLETFQTFEIPPEI